MLKGFQKAAEWLVLGLASVMALLALVSTAAGGNPADSATWRVGFKPMTVLGGSMEPAIHVGSMIVVARADTSALKVGDIITYAMPNRSDSVPSDSIATHRIVAIEKLAQGAVFRTKGDANDTADPWLIPRESVVGRPVAVVPYLGYVTRWATTRTGILCLVIGPGILLIVSEVMRMRRNRAASSPAEALTGEVVRQ